MKAASSISLACVCLVPFCLLNAVFKIHLSAAGQLEAFVLLIPGNPALTIYIKLKQWGGFVLAIRINSDSTQWPWSCKDLSVLLSSSTWIILGAAQSKVKLFLGICRMELLQIKLSSVMHFAQFRVILDNPKMNRTMLFVNHFYNLQCTLKMSVCLFDWV